MTPTPPPLYITSHHLGVQRMTLKLIPKLEKLAGVQMRTEDQLVQFLLQRCPHWIFMVTSYQFTTSSLI